MKNPPYALVDGVPVSFGAIWVHLKTESPPTASQLTIFIPVGCLNEVTGATQLKIADERSIDFIRRQLHEFGTFILEAYIKKLRQLVGDRPEQKRWVLTLVKDIEEKSEGLTLQCLAEAVDQEKAPRLF